MIVWVVNEVAEEIGPRVLVVGGVHGVNVVETAEARARHIGVQCSLRVELMVGMRAARLSREACARDADHTLVHSTVKL